MNNVGVIDQFLNTFTTYIDFGFGLIKGDINYLSSTLIAVDITLAGLFWAWGADEDVLQRLIKKTLYIGFFAFLIGNFNNLSAIIFNSFASLGLKAGGSSISTADFLRPGKLAQVGLDAGQPLLDAASQMMGFTSFFANFVQIAVLMVSWLIVLIAFFILAFSSSSRSIEFKLTTLAGFVLIPFALFNKTSFLAEKVLGNIVASGIKVMVLAVIVGIGTGLFSQFTTSYADIQPTVEQALSVVLAALAMLGLGIFGPGIATGLVSGAPQLGAGAVVGTGLAVAGRGRAAWAHGLAGIGGAVAGRSAAAAARGGAHTRGGGIDCLRTRFRRTNRRFRCRLRTGRCRQGGGSAQALPLGAPITRRGVRISESFQVRRRSFGFAATGGTSTAGHDWQAASKRETSPLPRHPPTCLGERMKRGQSHEPWRLDCCACRPRR